MSSDNLRDDAPMFPVPDGATAIGTSHRQWLAGLAMQSLILRMGGIPDTDSEREEIALWAYRMAEAMQKTEARLETHETEVTP